MRWTLRGVFLLVVVVLLLLAPIGYVELACRGAAVQDTYQPIITDAEWQRDESRTLTTYPEWHIVHAYDDYAAVIATGDPHDFQYLRAISGFWTSLCPLKELSAGMGGMTTESKLTIYTIGVSFTAELLAKAAYEKTLGRIATWIRGDVRSPLDDVSAAQAANYAESLQQTPWYKWDFKRDIATLETLGTESFRDRERRIALGNEYAVKALYARQIAKAVEGIGTDKLRLRSVVTGPAADILASIDGVTVVSEIASGTLIETDRYRAFTRILQNLASEGADVVEIAGNDEILFTAISDDPTHPRALYSFKRQGRGDYRHLILTPVDELAETLRNPGALSLEHVHDY